MHAKCLHPSIYDNGHNVQHSLTFRGFNGGLQLRSCYDWNVSYGRGSSFYKFPKKEKNVVVMV